MTLKNTPTNFSHKFKALQLTFQVVKVTLVLLHSFTHKRSARGLPALAGRGIAVALKAQSFHRQPLAPFLVLDN